IFQLEARDIIRLKGLFRYAYFEESLIHVPNPARSGSSAIEWIGLSGRRIPGMSRAAYGRRGGCLQASLRRWLTFCLGGWPGHRSEEGRVGDAGGRKGRF